MESPAAGWPASLGAAALATCALKRRRENPFVRAYAKEALRLLETAGEVAGRNPSAGCAEGALGTVNASLLAQLAFSNLDLQILPGEGWADFLSRTAHTADNPSGKGAEASVPGIVKEVAP